jgi:serine O-acetyltransferase
MMNDMPESPNSLDYIAERLREHHARFGELSGMSLGKVGGLLKETMAVMFPQYAEAEEDGLELEERLKKLEDTFFVLVDQLCKGKDIGCARLLVQNFLSDLPEIADYAYRDAQAMLEGDPAAHSLEEIILAYPGFFAIVAYRIAHKLEKRGVSLLPRLFTEYAHQRTGIDIHPGAQIGHSFYIDHGTGVVIGETCVIGNYVKIYQGVTLGGLRVDRDLRQTKRHPTIEDNVVIYAGATILGGETVIGKNSVIGGNVWITRSVPAWSRVMFKPADNDEIISIRSKQEAQSRG